MSFAMQQVHHDTETLALVELAEGDKEDASIMKVKEGVQAPLASTSRDDPTTCLVFNACVIFNDCMTPNLLVVGFVVRRASSMVRSFFALAFGEHGHSERARVQRIDVLMNGFVHPPVLWRCSVQFWLYFGKNAL